jgi:hypothetical protein
MNLVTDMRRTLPACQRREITEHHIDSTLVVTVRSPENRRVPEMAGLSLGVAAFSFLVGPLLRTLLGIDM